MDTGAHALHNQRSVYLLIENEKGRGYQDPPWEKEAHTVLLKYAHASKYFSGIGLNPDDIISLADHYSSLAGPESSGSTLSSPPPPSNADTELPMGGQRHEAGLVGSDAHDDLTTSAARTGQLPLLDETSGALDILYYGPAHFGMPPQMLTVDVDTGSADLWVPSGCGKCYGHRFEAARSSTFRSTNQEFSITYGTGKVSGKVVTDTVSIAGLTVANQAFGSVSNRSDEFSKQPNDGLIGMAFGTIAQSRQPTFFENLIKEHKIAAPLFSVHLSRHEERGSSVCLGCVDANWTTGPVTWLPVISKTYWAISMDGLWANGVKAPAKLTAAIDTGTSLIYVPHALASAFYDLIPGSKRASQYGSGFWTVPCFSVKQIELSFDGYRFAIDPKDFFLGRVSASSTDCVAGVLSIGNGLPSNLAIIGDEFLKSWYSTYDYGNGARVGFWPDVNNR
ncbi:acid protease [Russula compacta]|nr:acid protease [Russula compacta]